jgi:hypothetical protein
MSTDNKEQREKLLQLVKEALQQDKELREKHAIGDKFRFIRDRLNALLAHVEESISAMEKEIEKTIDKIAEDDVIVYVYIYNAQGLVMKTWGKMLSQSVLYEYSVNRPIYTDKAHIEAFIRSRPNKVQHGYLALAVKKHDISTAVGTELLKDSINNPLVKVKEGSLQFKRRISFTHNDVEYEVKENGELEKR